MNDKLKFMRLPAEFHREVALLAAQRGITKQEAFKIIARRLKEKRSKFQEGVKFDFRI